MKLDLKTVQNKIMEIGLKTGAGHIASAMTVSDLLVTIYNQSPEAIVILSKGHGVLAQYVCLNLLGKIPTKILDTYYTDGGLSGHATLNKKYGLYASTGSLGHGLAIGIGYAIASPKKRIVVVLGDGECEEGSTLESFKIIQRLKVKNIIPVIDINGWKGFEEAREDLLPLNAMKWFSVKGKNWGELEDTLDSHYKKVDQDLFNRWKENEQKSDNK